MKDSGKKTKMVLAIMIICVSLLSALTSPAIAVEYEYTELKMLPEGINNNGDVVGGGFLYRAGEYIEILPPQMNVAAGLHDINDGGVIVGSRVEDDTGRCKGFIYRDGKYTELCGWMPLLFNQLRRETFADRINNRGVVIGYLFQPSHLYKGFIFNNSLYTMLRIPLGWPGILPLGILPADINDKGVVVGNVLSLNSNLGTDSKGFIYYLGIYWWLLPPGYRTSSIKGINNKGMVVGDGEGANGLNKAFVYSGGKYIELFPEGSQKSFGSDINDNGDVAGTAFYSDGVRGFLYRNGEYSEIAVPGWNDTFVTKINNSGIVIGYGLDTRVGYTYKGFIAIPK